MEAITAALGPDGVSSVSFSPSEKRLGTASMRQVQQIADQFKIPEKLKKPIWRVVKELDSEKLKGCLVDLIRQLAYQATVGSTGALNSGTFFVDSDPSCINVNIGDLLKEYEVLAVSDTTLPETTLKTSATTEAKNPTKSGEQKNVFASLTDKVNPRSFVSSLSVAVKQHKIQPKKSFTWFEHLKSTLPILSPRSRSSLPEPIRPILVTTNQVSVTDDQLDVMRKAKNSSSSTYTPFSLAPIATSLSPSNRELTYLSRPTIPVVHLSSSNRHTSPRNNAISATASPSNEVPNHSTGVTNYATANTNYAISTTNYESSSAPVKVPPISTANLTVSPRFSPQISPRTLSPRNSFLASLHSGDVHESAPTEVPSLADYGIDWNKEYQDQISKIRELEAACRKEKKSPLEPDSEMSKILLAHQELFVAFNYAAKTYARVIINEVCIPDEEKTIPPSNLGGIAGGEKYIVKGIVFKFAQDKMISESPKPFWMYGGDGPNHKLAIKASGKEFLAMEAFIAHCSASKECDIRHPLMAIVDYKGFRIIATPLLPIDKSTIIYGSNDGGRTVHASDPAINHAMKLIASEMRIKGHRVGMREDQSQLLYSCGDFEIHKGLDGTYYALDFGRLLPPESPLESPQKDKRVVYYNFLRPEFTIYQDIPLSPDAFSLWSKLDEEKAENEKNLSLATRNLYYKIIPEFASEWEMENVINFNQPFGSLLHEIIMNVRLVEKARFRGINMRHLGYVRKHLKSQPHRKLVLSNCVARVIKNTIEEEWRNLMVFMKGTPTDLPFRSILCNTFNLVNGRRGRDSNLFWFRDVKEMLQNSFHEILSSEEMNPKFDLRDKIDLRIVMFFASAMVGVMFNPSSVETLMQDPANFEMLEIDVSEFAPKLRQPYIHFTSYSHLFRLGMSECNNDQVFSRLYTTCFGLCAIGTKIYPTSPQHNLESSYVSTAFILRNIPVYQKQPTLELFDAIESYFQIAFEKAESSISCAPDELNLKQWARVASQYGKWQGIRGHKSLSLAYENKANDVLNMAEKVKIMLQTSDGAFEYRNQSQRLAVFRHTTPTDTQAISPICRRVFKKSVSAQAPKALYSLDQYLIVARLGV